MSVHSFFQGRAALFDHLNYRQTLFSGILFIINKQKKNNQINKYFICDNTNEDNQIETAKPYALVEFNDQSVQVLPYKWLLVDKKICKYPNTCSNAVVRRSINNLVNAVEDWLQYSIKAVLGLYGN